MIAIPMIFAVLSYVIYAKCYKLKGKYLEEMIQKLNELHAA